MNFAESFQSAVYNVRANKMRSFLTMLGIIIGISSVITIVAIGQGAKNFMTGQFEGLGTNVINIQMKESRNVTVEDRDYFTLEDMNVIKSRMPEVEAISANLWSMGTASVGNKSIEASAAATNENFLKLQKLNVDSGRNLTEKDVQSESAVAVIDNVAAKKIFPNEDPIGQKIKVVSGKLSTSFRVIGVVKNPNEQLSAMFGDNSGTVIYPITLADRLVKKEQSHIRSLSVTITDMSKSKEVTAKIIKLLENRHRNSGKYKAADAFGDLAMINKVLNMLTAAIGAIAGISLLVGGIGVMNIMLVSVTERTREIGIRIAIGAKKNDIRIQFLTESMIICIIGGCIGMLLGVGLGFVIGKAMSITALPSIGVIIASFLFSSAVGIFFGYYPANQAAKLDPIEALRYE